MNTEDNTTNMAIQTKAEDAIKINTQETNAETEFNNFVKHPRYLSDIGCDVIELDVRTKGANNEKIYTINLNDTFAGYGDLSVYNSPLRLSDFTHIKTTIKHIINNRLIKHDDSSVISAEMSRIFSFYRNFYSYLFRQGIYRLDQITKDDIDTFVSDYIDNDGWWRLLGYEETLDGLFAQIEKEPELATEIAGIGIKDKARFALNTSTISNLTGLPMRSYVPADFSEKVRKRFFPNTLSKNLTNNFRDVISIPTLEHVFKRINDLNELPMGVDRIDFVPFPVASRLAKNLAAVKHEERTLNITPDYAVKLITTAYDWIYNKSPGVIELLETARETAEECLTTIAEGRYRGDKVRKAVQFRYDEIKDTYGFEYKSIGLDSSRPGHESCLGELVRIVQFSAFNMIGINHGRRKNELLGEGDRPYGLYLGCTSNASEELDVHKINIYVEKTVKNWSEFWCNKLVADSIDVLEQIYQLIRPLNTPPIVPTGDIDNDISNKLFVKRFFANVEKWADADLHRKSLQLVDYSKESDAFFKIVNPDGSKLDNKSHPNRRLFACLYYYRFEYAELLALRDHLGHMYTGMTHVYVSDPDTRKLSEQMSQQWKQEQYGLDSVMDEVRADYFKDIILQILEGNKVGGYWPRLIAKRLKTLSNSTKFDYESLTREDKVNIIYEKLASKGYSPNPKSNGVCMVGDSKLSSRMAKCYKETLNPQDAEPAICSGCVHLFTNENYIQTMKDDLNELESKSNDFRLPLVARKQAEEQANDLKVIIDKEINLSEENKTYLAENIIKWNGEDK